MLLSALNCWEKKRFIFHLVMGGVGFIIVFASPVYLIGINSTGIIMYLWPFCAICYSAVFLLEAFDPYYFKSELQIFRFRLILFIIGLLLAFFGALLIAYTTGHACFQELMST